MQTFRFLIIYTNDKRIIETKSTTEQDAIYSLKRKAQRELMQIIDIKLLSIIPKL